MDNHRIEIRDSLDYLRNICAQHLWASIHEHQIGHVAVKQQPIAGCYGRDFPRLARKGAPFAQVCFDSYHVRSGIFMVSKRLGQVMVPDGEIGSSRQQVS